jgi:signal transduction histidine kinase
LFDRFFRADPSRARGGAGLGLAICREIVLAHGGQIQVTSAEGEGSTFTFAIPVLDEGADANDGAEPGSGGGEPGSAR